MAIDVKLIDKLLADYERPEDIVGEEGLVKQLTKALRNGPCKPGSPNTWAMRSMILLGTRTGLGRHVHRLREWVEGFPESIAAAFPAKLQIARDPSIT